MAERDSLHAFPAKMAAAAVATRLAAPKAVAAGSLILTQRTRAQVRTVAPALFMRGVGTRGGAVGVTFNVQGDSGVVRATGPLHLLERDTKAKTIYPRRGRVLKLPAVGPKDAGVRRSANHPGTKGQHPFEKGIAYGLPPARAAITATLTRAASQALK